MVLIKFYMISFTSMQNNFPTKPCYMKEGKYLVCIGFTIRNIRVSNPSFINNFEIYLYFKFNESCLNNF